MRATSADKPWDFSHVLGLIDSLSNTATDTNRSHAQDGIGKRRDSPQDSVDSEDTSANDRVDKRDSATSAQNLGDFSRVYQYLGVPASSATPPASTSAVREAKEQAIELATKDDYASDGATYLKNLFSGVKSGVKNVKWDDNVSAEDPVTDNASDTSVIPDSPTLYKWQRKKRNRRERKERNALPPVKAATVSESEADVVSRKKTPASKASNHVRASTPNNNYNLRPRDDSGQVAKNNSAKQNDLQASVQTAVQKLEAAKRASAATKVAESDATPSKPPRPASNLTRTNSHPPASAQAGPSSQKNVPQPQTMQQQQQQKLHEYQIMHQLQNVPRPQNMPHPQNMSQPQNVPQSGNTAMWPVTPAQKQTAHLFHSTVQPPSHPAAQQMVTPSNTKPQQKTVPPKQPQVIEPMVVRSGEDRNWALFMKLIGGFWNDRAYLINPMNLTTHNNDPKGIHIFVDASNIFIGFNDQLKRSRNIPPWVQVPAVDLSFDALALLMERRRPVAKRVLAGSKPWVPAFDTAKAVGYECSILDKVYKARELTERQIFFKEQDRIMGRGKYGRAKAPPANTVATANGQANGNASGSETNAPQFAKAAMIEQGVDEILHLKILESIVDSDEPATIVLATGDAAQAEYSQGFMAMAERALKKGWTVELVSWSKNISSMYTRKEWTEAWGARFKIIFLDDYAEELLAM